MNDLPEINQCHFCDRIAEFAFDGLPICNECMIEHGGNEWDLFLTPEDYTLAQTFNRHLHDDWFLINSGTFKSMWELMYSLCADRDELP